MEQISIGNKIKELRNKNQLTQTQLALLVGVSNKAVSKWENGINLPEISLLRQMSKDFNVSISDILDGEITKKKNNKKRKKINQCSRGA